MSWGTCYSGSNNIHFGYPPIMNDGRNYSSWQPGAVINEQIRKEENITTNWQYRKYLTDNADSIIKYNQLESCDNCCAGIAKFGDDSSKPTTTATATPFLYKGCADNSTPFGYETSDLKNMYLGDYQLQSRMVTPVLTQAQILQQKYPNAN